MAPSSSSSRTFQFTPLREGRRRLRRRSAWACNFNSRPSARGDHAGAVVLRQRRDISIHAPPRGATMALSATKRKEEISIHAPPRGATHPAHASRREVRISIHAPPRGATKRCYMANMAWIFQFTPLREGRHGGMAIRTAGLEFQFTPLREGRPNMAVNGINSIIISIHAPPRGATAASARTGDRFAHFNSRPSARGDDDACIVDKRTESISIHAPPRGATTTLSGLSALPMYFNSRPSARGDGKRYAISANLLFNPYKSAWLNNSATQFVEIILVIFHRIIA